MKMFGLGSGVWLCLLEFSGPGLLKMFGLGSGVRLWLVGVLAISGSDGYLSFEWKASQVIFDSADNSRWRLGQGGAGVNENQHHPKPNPPQTQNPQNQKTLKILTTPIH